MDKPRILAMAGSLRTESFNRKLLKVGVQELESQGAQVDVVDLRELQLPIYDGDIEASTGHPKGSQELRERIEQAQGLFIASPEYNHSIPGGLKNAIDWFSRPPKLSFHKKVVAIAGASSGIFGTVRMQTHLRQSLTALGFWILPGSVLLPMAQNAFDAEGKLKDPARQKDVATLMSTLLSEVRLRS